MDRKRRMDAGDQVTEEDDEEEDEEGKEKPPPEKPVFNEAQILEAFDAKEENAIVQIPPEVVDDIDDDWPMNAEQEKQFLDNILNVN